jgi:hypothetical protein
MNVTMRTVNGYFRYMQNWDTAAKKNLISKLNSSLKEKADTNDDFLHFFGAWEDDKNAEEIINELKVDRVNSNENESF